MDEMDRFIGNENIMRFVGQLRAETDPRRQKTLKRLLIEEVSHFGATEERLRMIERHLTEGALHIVKQTNIVAAMKSRGHDSGKAENNLQASVVIQDLFQNFRSDVYAKVGSDGR